jgi:hypothetical protein
MGSAEFNNLAGRLYRGLEDCDLTEVTSLLELWIRGNDESQGEYSFERFLLNMKDQFSHSKKAGYYDWPGIRYLLFEYDENLRHKEQSKVKWEMPNSIDHIYPQTPVDSLWKKAFAAHTPKERKVLCHSLGNLVLLSHSKNSSLSNLPFKDKVYRKSANGNESGYKFGSRSEVEISLKKEWTPRQIYLRGMDMLQFLERRWEISLTQQQKKGLLLIDQNLMKKFR